MIDRAIPVKKEASLIQTTPRVLEIGVRTRVMMPRGRIANDNWNDEHIRDKRHGRYLIEVKGDKGKRAANGGDRDQYKHGDIFQNSIHRSVIFPFRNKE